MHPVTVRIIERAPRRLRPAAELTVRTVDDTFHDRVPGLAAEVAFFVLLSLPPLLLTLLAGAGVVGGWFDAAWKADFALFLQDAAGTVFSEATVRDTISPLLTALVQDADASVFGFGFVLTFLSASRALRVVSAAITVAYDLETTLPPWQQRLWGFGLTLGALLTGVALIPFVIAGPDLGGTISGWLGGVPGLEQAWRVAYWPAAGILLTVLIAALYHLAAPWWTPFHRDLPGAVLAMLLWLAGTVGLRVYVGQTIANNDIYGPIAGPLIVLLWLYVSAFAVLLGAELNAEVEKMWPTLPHLRHDANEGFVPVGQEGDERPGRRPSVAEPTVALPALRQGDDDAADVPKR